MNDSGVKPKGSAMTQIVKAKRENPKSLTLNILKFKNAFRGKIVLPTDEYITEKFVYLVLSREIALMILDEELSISYSKGSTKDDSRHYIRLLKKEDDVDEIIPKPFSISWIHTLVRNHPTGVLYLTSNKTVCLNQEYYMKICNHVVNSQFSIAINLISKWLEEYELQVSRADPIAKNAARIDDDLWDMYMKANAGGSVKAKGKDLFKGFSNESKNPAEMRKYESIPNGKVAPYIYSRLKQGSKAMIAQIILSIGMNKSYPEYLGAVSMTSESQKLFYLIRTSSMSDKLFETAFDLLRCLPIETKLNLLVRYSH